MLNQAAFRAALVSCNLRRSDERNKDAVEEDREKNHKRCSKACIELLLEHGVDRRAERVWWGSFQTGWTRTKLGVEGKAILHTLRVNPDRTSCSTTHRIFTLAR